MTTPTDVAGSLRGWAAAHDEHIGAEARALLGDLHRHLNARARLRRAFAEVDAELAGLPAPRRRALLLSRAHALRRELAHLDAELAARLT